jgi:D-amino peptidase
MRGVFQALAASSAMLLVPILVHAQAPGNRPLKVFITADMEGVAGVVVDRQTGVEGADYQQFRAFMTGEVNAAIEAALAAGASEVVVTDAHGGGTNLLPGSLSRRATLISGFPMPLGMMTGIDASFGAAVFIGAHASASDGPGVLGHTYTMALKHVRLNGQEVGECGLNMAMAGHFAVPMVLVSGDQTVGAEAHRLVPAIETVAVKEALGRTAARLIDPEMAQQRISDSVRSALHRLAQIPPFKLTNPVVLEVEVATTAQAERLMLIPNMQQISGRVVRYVAPDMLGAYRMSMLIERVAGE